MKKTAARRKSTPTEESEQIAVFRWAELQTQRYPFLRYLYHTPNGGKRDRVTAARLKAAGVKKGVPDICLPVPLGGYHGLYIEMKVGYNKPTNDQEDWLDALSGFGYRTAVCYGFDEAVEELKKYIALAGGKDIV